MAAKAASDLHEAVRNNDIEEIQRLLAEGADINALGPGQQTPLLSGVLVGRKEAVEALLEAGADLTIPEKDGYTVMHAAGFQGRADIVPILFDHGVSPNDFHRDGFAPYHRACWGKDERHLQTIKAFAEIGVDLDTPAQNGQTCKHLMRGLNPNGNHDKANVIEL
eukprot:CAMPEP_0118873946 /NCGR_PEP_ID=MMETSP1163-20130328/15565_1 /TAXON_ID=124430 /ORGANISM="Phaeomonas parva, Strain CCMP2877" /LENGTH=164 /DNA_ID=CAMNT_0006809269 /DNA_START=44 /DNA_END=538 /DNA_ORIENTATION=+